MKSFSFSRIRSYIVLVALLLLTGGMGYRLGERHALPFISTSTSPVQTVTNTSNPPSASADFSLFWNVWQKMFQYYFDAKTLDAQKMVYGAITGMVASAGDPFTSFLPPKENQDFKQDIGGEFEGIGAQLDLKDGRIIVATPLKGSPAEAAGIKPGDYILKVDGQDTTGWTVQDAVTKIRGPRDTKITLNILHTNARAPVDIPVTRNTILVPSVESWVKSVSSITEIKDASESAQIVNRPDRIAYLKLSRFGDHTNDDWIHAVDGILAEQKNGEIKGLVFDLRNNPGGYLEGAVFIASEFIKSGTVVSQKNSDGTKQDLTVDRAGRLTDMPMVILVNKGSASAAEIVAGALKDYNRGKIVGETTFGKGSVQTPFDLTQGASVHITTGKWFLPKGDSISQKGITPDVVVVPPDLYSATDDTQLAKAIDLLLR